ncbi:G-protein coupled receptor 135 [Galemys pyrenaicus]|uniref:G-protein coupled receptor 135 n=1 Tax=Galemys pyrenaicus TaxID=202257 RepID=A0A8J6A4X7_GALPY|nr:G-protein coupled receptor 135 [Galemys pyrenaicus]
MEEQRPAPPARPPVSMAWLGSPHPGAPSAAGTPGGTLSVATAAAALSFSTAAAAVLGNQSDGSGGGTAGASAGGGLAGRGAAGAAGLAGAAGRPPLGPEAAPLLPHGAAVAAQALVLLLIFLLSSLGNCAVMGVIVKHRQLRTVTNAFILSLSLSDLLTALLCLPAAFLDLFTPPGGLAPAATSPAAASAGPWRGFCAASRFFSSCFGIVSTLSVALISLDRYCAIVRPPREKIGRRRALQLLAGAWLAALGFSLPWELLRAPREPAEVQSFHGCLYRISPDPAQLGAAYSVGLVVACYLLPFLLMCFCHYHICKTVRLSDVRVRPVTTYARVLRFFSEVRTATTVLIMIVFVICCSGPYCFLVLLAAARQAQATQAPSLLHVVAVWLTWANGAINPVIYAIRNPNISMLLGRNREEGYRTRNVDTFLPNHDPGLQNRSRNRLRNRYANRLGACSRMSSSNPASGAEGDVVMWACKNPVVLFCGEGPPDPVTAVAKKPKSEAGDTSL